MKLLQYYRFIDVIAKTGSIRGASDELAITPSALNRRVQAVEEELGAPIFERLPRGVRLNAAGELFIHHLRNQLSDMERVRSQIADLSGIRRGHVNIACSQAVLPYFLPRQVAAYREEHPGVTFRVYARDRAAAELALAEHSADIAIVFEPIRMAEFQTLLTVRQPLFCLMRTDHPLARQETVRLYDCLAHDIALPTEPYGVRQLLEVAVRRFTMQRLVLEPVVESDSFEFLRFCVSAEGLLSFQIPIGLTQFDERDDITARPVDTGDVREGLLYVGQLAGRNLPIAASRFVDQILKVFEAEGLVVSP